MRPDLKTSTLR
jgi:hypothetical protein